MTEIETKLNSGNPIFVAQAASKLVEVILKKLKENPTNPKKLKEYKLLEQNCTNTDPKISLVCGKAILKLVEHAVLDPAVLIKDFVYSVQNSSELTGPVYVIYNLLLLEFVKQMEHLEKLKNKKYDMLSNPHPLVQVVSQSKECLPFVFSHIKEFYQNDNKRIICHGNEVFSPLYFYLFHDYSIPKHLKQQLVQFLIKNEKSQSMTISKRILRWKWVNSKDDLQDLKYFLSCIIEKNDGTESSNAFALIMSSILYEEVHNALNPEETIAALKDIIKNNGISYAANCVALILSQCISYVCSVYLKSVLNLCLLLIENNNINAIILEAIKASLLPWILYPNLQDTYTMETAEKILAHAKQQKTESVSEKIWTNLTFNVLKSCGEHAEIAFNLCVTAESWKDESDLKAWLEKLEQSKTITAKRIFNFLSAILISDFSDCTINIAALKILLKCFQNHRDAANNLLVLVLHKLSKTTDSELNFELLKALPKMSSRKENLQLILLTLDSLKKGTGDLQTLALRLFYDLWEVNNKYYCYLEKILVEESSNQSSDYYIAKANIFMELCQKRPELYGKDMVPHLSKILNHCTGPGKEEIACALAIKGIKNLCKSGIVNIETTWKTLSPTFGDDGRAPVIQSLCGLLSEIPNLLDVNDSANDTIIKEVILKLWNFVLQRSDPREIQGALNALSSFTLEQISEYIPEEFKDENTEMDQFNQISGHCWIRFLQLAPTPVLKLRGNFLTTFIKSEISSYHRGIYEVTHQSGEPGNYGYLPHYSIVGAVGNHLKINVQRWKNPVYIECLRIFSHEYSKPLPPFNWTFLQEFVHEPETRQYCIDIASHQVVLSGTARRFMQNYMQAITEVYTNEEDILQIYKNLKYLCNSIQPSIMRPFIEKSLEHFTEQNICNATLSEIIRLIKNTLLDEKVQETNKCVLAEVISKKSSTLFKTNVEMFEKFLECIIAFPKKYLEQLNQMTTTEEIQMCFKIHCYGAVNSQKTSLEWLNEVIYFSDYHTIADTSVLLEVVQVLKKLQNNPENISWAMELMGNIQNIITENQKAQALPLLDILLSAVITFSGNDIFLKDTAVKSMGKLFPCSIRDLLKNDDWNRLSSYVLEWLYNMVNLEEMPEEYKEIFRESILNLKNESNFQSNLSWMKYMGIEFL